MHPVNEMIKRNFRPCVSTNRAAKSVPAIWTVASTMDDSSDEKLVPDLENIVDAYVMKT